MGPGYFVSQNSGMTIVDTYSYLAMPYLFPYQILKTDEEIYIFSPDITNRGNNMKNHPTEELEQEIDDMNLADTEEVQESKSSEEVLLLKEEISDLTDKLLRNAAEAENLRKRYEKQLDEGKEGENKKEEELQKMKEFENRLLELENQLTSII